jgi:3-methylcrotonyl-CoA carboxylase alpha subunit
MIKKILIANRGEIACRIARTCREMGISVAAVHSDADRNALHVREVGQSVRLGEAPASASYLNFDAIIRAARQVGADAIHPGYGFLSENPDFAEACRAAEITFIGPSPAILRQFGDKSSAKAVAKKAGVPTVPGSKTASDDPAAILAEIKTMRLPVMLKAAGGGGGKGMRVVDNIDDAENQIDAAMREGLNSFSDPRLLVEEFLPDARHIEVQILGDGNGNVIHLFERECSLQRRHQKVIEEAPAPDLDDALREEVIASAVKLARAVNYAGLGTVEFIIKDKRAYFLEVNPRLQVEHPVTERVTGLDLVALQIGAIADGALTLQQANVSLSGHAIEARIYAENPLENFIPSTGQIDDLQLPENVRVDAGIDRGMTISPFYDPMIAKLISHGADRSEALRQMSTALGQTSVSGVTANTEFLGALLNHPMVLRGAGDTGFIDRELDGLLGAATVDAADIAVAGAIWLAQNQSGIYWRLGDGTAALALAPSFILLHQDREYPIHLGPPDRNGAILVGPMDAAKRLKVEPLAVGQYQVHMDDEIRTIPADAEKNWVRVNGMTFAVRPYLDTARLGGAAMADGTVTAPLMGQVLAANANVGDQVDKGDVLVILESMKMEIRISAPAAGRVTAVHCQVGGNVERGAVIVEIELESEGS